jgi:L-ascorbate metabolism protein UlaG (beta-lactamase superfamily)
MSYELTWYGHATLGLKTGGFQLLIDPYFDDNPAASASAKEVGADYILVTHGHHDHLGETVEIAERTGALVITNSEISKWLEKQKVRTHAQQLGGGYHHPFGYLKFTMALHSSSLPDGSYGGNPAGLLLNTNDGEKLYFAGDTGLFGDMQLIGEEGIDLAVLPIGDNYTMGPEDAIWAVKLLQPKHVMPIHFNTWVLLNQDGKVWCDQVEESTATKAHLLKPGQKLILENGAVRVK